MIIRTDNDYMLDVRMNGGSGIAVGKSYAVAEEENLTSGEKRYIFKSPDSGFAGNMDRSIKRYHGWRGTTNDWQRYALGVFKVMGIAEQKNGKTKITLSNDLHPDWE